MASPLEGPSEKVIVLQLSHANFEDSYWLNREMARRGFVEIDHCMNRTAFRGDFEEFRRQVTPLANSHGIRIVRLLHVIDPGPGLCLEFPEDGYEWVKIDKVRREKGQYGLFVPPATNHDEPTPVVQGLVEVLDSAGRTRSASRSLAIHFTTELKEENLAQLRQLDPNAKVQGQTVILQAPEQFLFIRPERSAPEPKESRMDETP